MSAVPGRRRRSRRLRPLPPAPLRSERLYLELPPEQAGMFRFLLEAHDNLALFTVLDRRRAVLQLSFAPGRRPLVLAALADMAPLLQIQIIETSIGLRDMPDPADMIAKDPTTP